MKVGIDIGSTTVKFVVMDDAKKNYSQRVYSALFDRKLF